MQYSSIFLAALAATSTLASPWTRPSADNEIRVVLSDRVQNVFPEGKRSMQHPSRSGPFKTVELRVGKNLENQALRCQVLDHARKPITVLRGANKDITFADGDKGKWTFQNPSKVSMIICDPAFKQVKAKRATSSDKEIRVQLSNQSIELGIQRAFTEGERDEQSIRISDPFETIEISVGEDAQNQDVRCQVLDQANNAIVATRGTNTDITFSDSDKGEWTFKEPSVVSKIICDPAFKAASTT